MRSNGFDPEDHDDATRCPPDRFTLTFTGRTHGEREDLTTILDALTGLMAEAQRL